MFFCSSLKNKSDRTHIYPIFKSHNLKNPLYLVDFLILFEDVF